MTLLRASPLRGVVPAATPLGTRSGLVTRTADGTVRLLVVPAYGRVSGMSTTSNPYRGFRFPAEIINQAVWLYYCFSLSLREVELIATLTGRAILTHWNVPKPKSELRVVSG